MMRGIPGQMIGGLLVGLPSIASSRPCEIRANTSSALWTDMQLTDIAATVESVRLIDLTV